MLSCAPRHAARADVERARAPRAFDVRRHCFTYVRGRCLFCLMLSDAAACAAAAIAADAAALCCRADFSSVAATRR